MFLVHQRVQNGGGQSAAALGPKARGKSTGAELNGPNSTAVAITSRGTKDFVGMTTSVL